jgi:hypothetical protein
MIGLKYLYAMLAGAFSGQPALNLRGRRPAGSQLRNPADPVQAARIEAAKLKRYRKALKLRSDMPTATANNDANLRCADALYSLSPFYVAK